MPQSPVTPTAAPTIEVKLIDGIPEKNFPYGQDRKRESFEAKVKEALTGGWELAGFTSTGGGMAPSLAALLVRKK